VPLVNDAFQTALPNHVGSSSGAEFGRIGKLSATTDAEANHRKIRADPAGGGEEVAVFIPNALPPSGPPIAIDVRLTERIRRGEQALVRHELSGEMVLLLDLFSITKSF
jgi:hypothetical protein